MSPVSFQRVHDRSAIATAAASIRLVSRALPSPGATHGRNASSSQVVWSDWWAVSSFRPTRRAGPPASRCRSSTTPWRKPLNASPEFASCRRCVGDEPEPLRRRAAEATRLRRRLAGNQQSRPAKPLDCCEMLLPARGPGDRKHAFDLRQHQPPAEVVAQQERRALRVTARRARLR